MRNRFDKELDILNNELIEMGSMIEIAIEIIKTADVFVIAGTSLQVYPAAGLVDYLSSDVPRYLIDPNPPSNYNLENIHVIKKTATKGVKELISLLNLL